MTGPTGASGAGRPAPDDAPEVIYLDVDDEITSAAARLRRTDAERIALVLPYGSRLATSRINFRLLAREAGVRGKRLEIVAPDASARALAGSAGLPVHASVAALEAGEAGGPTPAPDEPVPVVPAPPSDGTETRILAVPRAPERIPTVGRRRPPVRSRTAFLAAAVIVALVAAGGVGAFLYLPSATIVLTPSTEQIGPENLTIQARTDVTTPDLATLTVPARTFDFDVVATQTFTTTGVKVTEARASGNVTFTNCDPTSKGAVTIPAGSRVATQAGIEFVTLGSLTIRRATLTSCRTGSVAIEAVAAGTAGNVSANQITRIPPANDPLVLFVTNPQPTSGGARSETPQVSQQDVDAALTQLTTALRDSFDQQVRDGQGVPAGTTLFDATEVLGTATPSVDPATLVGQSVPQFELGLSTTGTVLGADPTPVTTLAEQRLGADVGPGWRLVEGTTHVQVGAPTVAGDIVSFPVEVTATRARVVDHDALVAQIRGLVLAEARGRLDDFGTVQISLWPDWVSTIPTDTSRISLTIESVGPSPPAGPAGSAPGPGESQPAGSAAP